ncbi:MAG: hypothetical protein AB7S78_03255 [Candidatus Omnitrophota bacterium]
MNSQYSRVTFSKVLSFILTQAISLIIVLTVYVYTNFPYFSETITFILSFLLGFGFFFAFRKWFYKYYSSFNAIMALLSFLILFLSYVCFQKLIVKFGDKYDVVVEGESINNY